MWVPGRADIINYKDYDLFLLLLIKQSNILTLRNTRQQLWPHLIIPWARACFVFLCTLESRGVYISYQEHLQKVLLLLGASLLTQETIFFSLNSQTNNDTMLFFSDQFSRGPDIWDKHHWQSRDHGAGVSLWPWLHCHMSGPGVIVRMCIQTESIMAETMARHRVLSSKEI